MKKNSLLNIIKNYQSYKDALIKTKTMMNNIKYNSDYYDLDSRINYLEKNNIKVKYKGLTR